MNRGANSDRAGGQGLLNQVENLCTRRRRLPGAAAQLLIEHGLGTELRARPATLRYEPVQT